MKLKNVKVGMKVKVKESRQFNGCANSSSLGKIGVVSDVDICASNSLSVRIRFSDDSWDYDWMNHVQVRKIKDVEHPTTPKFKVGDIVKAIEGTLTDVCTFPIGTAFRVVKVCKSDDLSYYELSTKNKPFTQTDKECFLELVY